MEYTRRQKETIARAYSAIRRIVESDHKAEAMLSDAYRHERRERGDKTLTEALLIESFLDGWHKKYEVADLLGLAPGCASLVILGAVAQHHNAVKRCRRFPVTEADLALLTGAHLVAQEASQASHERRMAELAAR